MRAAPAVALALVVGLPVLAAADEVGRSETLAALPASAWQDSISALDRNVFELEPNVRELDRNVIEIDRQTTEGEETVIALTSDVLFGFDRSDIAAPAQARIAELLGDIPQGAAVSVHGHTDGRGTAEYNQQLSEARAASVAAVITAARPDLVLDVAGFGMTQPVEPNTVDGEDNPEGRAANRRVEVRFEG